MCSGTAHSRFCNAQGAIHSFFKKQELNTVDRTRTRRGGGQYRVYHFKYPQELNTVGLASIQGLHSVDPAFVQGLHKVYFCIPNALRSGTQ